MVELEAQMAKHHGYSGKPLSAKLGIKAGQRLLALGAPDHYGALVGPLPEGARLLYGNWARLERGAEIVHAFFAERDALAARADELVALPAPRGMIWVSWPKNTSSLFYDLTDNEGRALMLPTGWVDIKVAAVDADWSGLKFVKRASLGSGS
jgi:hypothetical protein